MFELIAVLMVIASFAAGAMLFGLTFSIVYHLVAGLIVGALARAVVPGAKNIGLLATSLYGIAGGALGGVVGRGMALGQIGQLILSVIAASVLLTVFGKASRRRS